MKKIYRLLFIFVLLFTFSALGSFAGGDKEEEKEVVIKVMVSGDSAITTLEPLTAEFEEENPDIKVELNIVSWDVLMQQVPIILSTGQYEYDIIDLWEPWIDSYNARETLVDLSDYLSEEIQAADPKIIDDVTIGDAVIGIPFLPSYQIMFFNKELVAEAGLDPNKPPRTIDEFKDWLRKLSLDTDNDGIIDRYAFIFDFSPEWGINFFGVLHKAFDGQPLEIVNGKANIRLDTPEMRDTINFIKELYGEGVIAPGIFTQQSWDVTSMYNQGEIPLLNTFDMFAAYLNEDMLKKTGFFAFPGKIKGTYATANGHEHYAIPKSSPNIEAAMKYLKFISSPENMRMRSRVNFTIPLYAEDWNDEKLLAELPWLIEVKKAKADESQLAWPIEENRNLFMYMISKAHECVLGQITTDEFLKDIQSEADKYKTIDTAVDRGVYKEFTK
jgi:multiple sugar transport system substrate-binding protein